MNVNIPSSCGQPLVVKGRVADDAEISAAAKMFAALSDPVRLRLFLNVAAQVDEVCACDLVGPSGRSQPTVSHHMKVLVEAELLERTKRGQWVWYRVNPDGLAAARSMISGVGNDA
jgi:ArsR family transcriptional regulator, arsenate/arsenite/antimonite-responsive transcriptional repressor